MRHITCEQCGGVFPTTGSFAVLGQVLCEACARQRLAQEPALGSQSDAVAALIDPTICARCGGDQGTVELERICEAPVCDLCAEFLRRRPFPTWVKAGALVAVVLVAAGLYRNERFFSAYGSFIRSTRAAQGGRFEEAYRHAEAAAQRVPESMELVCGAAMCHGFWLLSEERDEEALPYLRQALAAWPSYPELQYAVLMAEANVEFTAGDYDTFLDKQKVDLHRDPSDSRRVLGVASGYACKYAATGDETYKQEALKYMEQAKGLESSADPRYREELRKYEMRIRHRLATREILTRKQFEARYPSGWKEGGAP